MAAKLDTFFSWLLVHHSQTVDNPGMLQEVIMGDEEFANDVVLTAVSSLKEYAQAIESADWQEGGQAMHIAIHSLKSTVLTLGMNSLGEFLQGLEVKLKRGEAISHDEKKELQQKTAIALAVVVDMQKQLNALL